MNTVDLICRDAYQQTPGMPQFLSGSSTFFCRAHIFYSSIRQGRIFAKLDLSQQEHAIVCGAALHVLENELTCFAIAVNVLLVAKCTLDLIEHYQHLNEAYQNLNCAFFILFPGHIKSVKFQNSLTIKSRPLTSPSFHQKYWSKIIYIILVLKKIIICALLVLLEVFKTSMCLRDIYLVFNNDARARFEACTLLVADCDAYRSKLNASIECVYKKIEKQAILIDRLLTLSSSEQSAVSLAKGLNATKTVVVSEVQAMGHAVKRVQRLYYHSQGLTEFCLTLPKPKSIPEFPEPVKGPFWQGENVELPKKNQLKQLFIEPIPNDYLSIDEENELNNEAFTRKKKAEEKGCIIF